MTDRTPRALEKRVHETRTAETKPRISFDFTSRFNVPAVLREAYPDKVFDFIPYQAGGESLEADIDLALNNRGYDLVRESLHPSLRSKSAEAIFGKKDEDSIKRVGGQVLMMRDKEDAIAENAHYDEMVNRQKQMTEKYTQGPAQLKPVIDDRQWK